MSAVSAPRRSHETVERLEQRVLRELHLAADPPLRKSLGLAAHEIGGAFVSVASRDPGILLNRVLGLGLERAATRETVRTITEIYREAGLERWFVQPPPGARPAELIDWLREAGLSPQRRWMKFAREGTPPDREPDADIRPVDEATAPDFGRIVAEGFGLTPEAGPLLARLSGRPGWHPFLAFVDGRPAAAAALFVHDDLGWCDWAATSEKFRGRGLQNALLAHRLRLAAEHGCREIYCTTGEEVPGDPQHSYHNILRAGFRELYLRDNYAPPG